MAAADARDDRSAWHEDADWIWDTSINADLNKEATLRAQLRSTRTDLRESLAAFTKKLTPGPTDTWYYGGVELVVKLQDAHAAEVACSSSGEDSFESIADMARQLFDRVVRRDADVTVRWHQDPLH